MSGLYLIRITEEQAKELISETEAFYQKLEELCEKELKRLDMPVQIKYTKDMGVQLIYLLYQICKAEEKDYDALGNYGFPYHMIWKLKILMENEEQVKKILNSSPAT